MIGLIVAGIVLLVIGVVSLKTLLRQSPNGKERDKIEKKKEAEKTATTDDKETPKGKSLVKKKSWFARFSLNALLILVGCIALVGLVLGGIYAYDKYTQTIPNSLPPDSDSVTQVDKHTWVAIAAEMPMWYREDSSAVGRRFDCGSYTLEIKPATGPIYLYGPDTLGLDHPPNLPELLASHVRLASIDGHTVGYIAWRYLKQDLVSR